MDNKEKNQLAFDAFIEEYKEKTLLEKQTILVQELKELIAIGQKMCMEKKINCELILNREIIDINNKDYTEDDYVEAIYTYLQTFKEILAAYVINSQQ